MKKSKVTNNKQGSVFSTHSIDQGIKIYNYRRQLYPIEIKLHT